MTTLSLNTWHDNYFVIICIQCNEIIDLERFLNLQLAQLDRDFLSTDRHYRVYLNHDHLPIYPIRYDNYASGQ